MHWKNRFFLWLFVGFTLVPLAGAQVYGITDLGILPTGTFSYATGINNFGHVTGVADVLNSYSERVHRAVLWTTNGGMQDLGTLPNIVNDSSFASWANGVNDLGVVVGGSWYDQEENHAFLWSQSGGMRDLRTPHGMVGSDAQSINLFGQVAGAGFEIGPGDSGPSHAFLWTTAGGMHLLGHLPGGKYSYAYGINDFGQVVGIADTDGFWYDLNHAFLWTKRRGMVDMGVWSAAAINNLGQVVGSGPNFHAVLWTRKRGLRDLGTLPGGIYSSAAAINDFGLLVGSSATTMSYPYAFHAMLWSQHSGMQDLNNLIPADSGWVLEAATGINILGQVVGYGTINGQEHEFLLTPNL
jgi:probable HAF family extracellular repeat protein